MFLGLSFSSGKNWQEQRKFAMNSLRELGFGKGRMEQAVDEQVEKFVTHLRNDIKGEPTSTANLFEVPLWNKETDSNNCKTPCPQIPVINALWSVLTGQSLDEDDPVVKSIYKAVSDIGDLSGTPLFLLAILVPPVYKVMKMFI